MIYFITTPKVNLLKDIGIKSQRFLVLLRQSVDHRPFKKVKKLNS